MSVDAALLDTASRYRVGRLATVDDRAPHLVPVVFVVVRGDFWVPIDGKPKTTTRLKRVRNIEANDRVALLFDDYAEDWRELRWLRVDGRASVVPTPIDVVRSLREKYPQYASTDVGETAIHIEPERTTTWAMANA